MGDWVIAGQPKGSLPEIGKTYEVRHSRKGTLVIKVEEINGEWLTGELVSGKEKLASRFSMPTRPGEEITVRDVHSYLIPIQ